MTKLTAIQFIDLPTEPNDLQIVFVACTQMFGRTYMLSDDLDPAIDTANGPGSANETLLKWMRENGVDLIFE